MIEETTNNEDEDKKRGSSADEQTHNNERWSKRGFEEIVRCESNRMDWQDGI
jgi:hypothetical protein